MLGRNRSQRRDRVGVGTPLWQWVLCGPVLVACAVCFWWYCDGPQRYGVPLLCYQVAAALITWIVISRWLRFRALADARGISWRVRNGTRTVPWSQVTGCRTERSRRGTAIQCVVCGEGGAELATVDFANTPAAERERFLAFVEANIAAHGRSELLSAGAPEGTGTEPEAARAPAGGREVPGREQAGR